MDTVTAILFVIIALTSIVFILRKKLIRVMSIGIRILFVVFLVWGLISLFTPQIYDSLADNTLRNIGTYQTIVDIDKSIPIDQVKNAPQNLWNDIKNIFNPGQGQAQNNTTTSQNTKGLLEGSLYVGMVTLIAFILRVVGIVISISGLILVTYLSYTTAGATDVDEVRRKVNVLEKKLELLEKTGAEV